MRSPKLNPLWFLFAVLLCSSTVAQPGAQSGREGFYEAMTALRNQEWSRAAELYRGDYLEEFGSEWCALERENLRTRFITAMIELADLLMEMGDLDGALHYYNRTLAYDPLQEIVYRRAMECYARLGDRASAAEKYRQCVEALQRELGLEPMRETRETYRRIMG